jgi:hypothetical protein
MIKSTDAPSIPSHNNIYGYEEDDRGQLIKQVNKLPNMTGVGADSAGPGQYIAITNERKIAGPVTEWKLANEKSLGGRQIA